MTDKKLVLLVSDGDDMAGVNYSLMEAINRFSTKYRARQVRGTNNYIDYPVDITWMGRNTEVNALYQEASLIHISEYPWALDGGSAPKIWDKVPKPTVIHQHGQPFRNNASRFLELARISSYTQLVSTVDLLAYGEPLIWLPNPVDVDRMQEIRRQHYPNDGKIRLGQAPTNRSVKNTDVFIAACKDLQELHDIDYYVIEKQKWSDTLRLKAQCDIWFDQLSLGYGNNGIEAMAMGIPCVGGYSNREDRDRLVDITNRVPFTDCTPDDARYVLESLVRDTEYRREAGARALSFVSQYHSYPSVARRIEMIYDQTIERFKETHE
jgi:glycosyltransferase involved in cell wall biosynthesis